MIEAPGIVDEVIGDAVWVRLTEQDAGCGRCHEPGGCGGVRIAHAFGKPNDRFRITGGQDYAVGDIVQLVADDRAALYAGLTSYGWPTLGAILGAAAGTQVEPELGAAVGLALGLAGAAMMASRLSGWLGWSDRMRVTIRRRSGSCAHPASR